MGLKCFAKVNPQQKLRRPEMKTLKIELSMPFSLLLPEFVKEHLRYD
jgi:hypothetical protein